MIVLMILFAAYMAIGSAEGQDAAGNQLKTWCHVAIASAYGAKVVMDAYGYLAPYLSHILSG